MGMDRSTLPSADPSTVWLADLIEATEVVAGSAEQCHSAIVKAFRHRLELRAECQAPVRAHRLTGGLKTPSIIVKLHPGRQDNSREAAGKVRRPVES